MQYTLSPSHKREARPDVFRRKIRAKSHLHWRIGGGLFALFMLAGMLLGVGGTRVAYAQSLFISTIHESANGSGSNSPQLIYYGNNFPNDPTIQHHPHVHLVFWGPAWADSTLTSIINQVEATFKILPGSSYNNILSQYYDRTGDYVHNDVAFNLPTDVWLDTGSTPGSDLNVATNVRDEVGRAFQNNASWSQSPDTQIIVFPQPGTTYLDGNACGAHYFDGPLNNTGYSYIRYGGDGNCNTTGDIAESTAWSAVHEYAETATDLTMYLPTGCLCIAGEGWTTDLKSNDTAGSSPHEVADLCEGWTPSSGDLGQSWPDYIDPATGQSYTLPFLWSETDRILNGGQGCVMSFGEDFKSPASPGRHTVENPLLNEYQKVGADSSVIGPPISETTPMGSGYVSYFTGGCSTNYPSGNCAAIYWSSGSGAHYVRNAEYAEYVKVGQAPSVIGFPVSDDTAIGGGSVTYFNGTCGGSTQCAGIYWSSGSGAHYVRGAEFDEYKAVGQAASVIGFPVSDDTAIGSGSVTYFNGTCGGSAQCAGIYWSSGSGAHYVRGAEFDEYKAVGQAASVIGFPVSDDTAIGNGSVTYFNGTCGGSTKCAGIYWSGSTGAHYVRGAEYNEYVSVHEATGVLGFPLTDDTSVSGGSATYFTGGNCGNPGPAGSNGAIYWSGSTGAHEVHGCIYAIYLNSFGGTGGVLGFPLSDELGITAIGGNSGRVNYFAGGNCGNPGPYNSNSALYWTGSAGYEVQGCIYAKYVQTGGPAGVLGFPVSNEYTNSAGYRESDFEYGSIIWKNGVAVVYNGCKVSATVYTC